MPVIFGHEVKPAVIWVAGGALAVGAVIYLRNQASGASASAAPQTPADTGGGGSGGGGAVQVPAPSDQSAANYNTALQDIQLQAAKFGLQQQQTQADEQQRQFDLQYALQKAQQDLQIGFGQATLQGQEDVANAQAGQAAAIQNAQAAQIKKTGISCAGTDSPRYGIIPGSNPPQIGWFCRQKTSGSIGPIPVGSISRTGENFARGVESQAGNAGAAAGQAAGAGFAAWIKQAMGQFNPFAAPSSGFSQADQSAALYGNSGVYVP